MTKSSQLLSLAIFLAGSLPSDCQEAGLLIDRPADLPSLMHWNHKVARTVGRVCYQVIHDQLTFFPAGYTDYGLRRTGRDGVSYVKPYWRSNPYEEAGGLKKWLQQNRKLSFRQMRIQCLTWLMEGEKQIGVVDPAGYFLHVLPLELGILELRASDGQDVTQELVRVRKLSRTRSADQVPKELLPDGPLPKIEEIERVSPD